MSRRDLAEAGAVMAGAVVASWMFLIAFVTCPVWGPPLLLWLWWRGRG